MNYGDQLWERALIGGICDCTRERTRCSCAAHDETQENRVRQGRLTPGSPAGGKRPPGRRAYFGGLLSGGGVDDGGVELIAPFGLLESAGGIVVVVPGEVD